MESTVSSPEISTFEKLLVGIDSGPFGALYRVAIGLAAIPAMSWLCGNQGSDWILALFVLTILVLLRVLPAIVRMLVSFSDPVRGIWAGRRQMAKRYDSYQWQKLFWIGAGLALYTTVSGQFWRSRIVVSSICLITGALGMLRWRAVSPQHHGGAGLPAQEERKAT